MPELAAEAPWWVVAGLTIAIFLGIFRAARWTAHTDSRLNTLEALVTEIREDVKKIFGCLPPPQSVRESSPVQLTDFGRNISATGSAAQWARTNAPKLEADAAGQEEFEVFDLCVAYVENLFANDADFQRTVRATAYQHGTEPEQVLKVYQVELRDLLLPPTA